MIKNNLKLIISFLIILFAVIISVYPDFYRISQTPKGHFFPLVHNNAQDYFYYLSLMRQGFDGNLLLTSKMTAENFQPVFAQNLFALLGFFAKITNISLVWVYFLARIFFGIGLLSISFYLGKIIFPKLKYFILTCLTIAIVGGFWNVKMVDGKIIINQFLSVWTRFNPILRTTYLPHHLFSTILGIVSLIFLSQSLEQKNYKKLYFASILGLISGFIYFATMLNIIGGIFIAFVLFIIKNHLYIKKNINLLWTYIYFLAIYIAVTSIAFFYFYYLSKTIFPWSSYDKVGANFTFGFRLWEYLAALGLPLILTFIGLPKILKSKSILIYILLGWIIFPIIGIKIVPIFYHQVGDVYFLEATSYIPLGILSVFGFIQLEEKLKNNIKLIYLLLLLLILLYSLPPIYASIKSELQVFPKTYYNIYLPFDVLQGINWLDQYTNQDDIILAGGFFGNIIPAFSKNRVVYGHPANSYNSYEKQHDLNTFFSNMDYKSKLNILTKYRVRYVFYSLDTDPPDDTTINKLNLLKRYQNSSVTIYQINN